VGVAIVSGVAVVAGIVGGVLLRNFGRKRWEVRFLVRWSV
jgi:mitochondrial fission 1 protein